VADDGDPVPAEISRSVEEALGVLEAFEDALAALVEAGVALGRQDEVAIMIVGVRHGKVGCEDGGLR
jgi:hypothetical protein